MSTISELLIKIGCDNTGLNKGLQESKQQLDKTFSDVNPMKSAEGAINDVSGSITGLIGKANGLIALAAGGFGFNAIVQSAVDAGAGLQNLADIMGVSAAEASSFSKTITIAGGDVETAQKSLMRLDKAMQETGNSGDLCRNTFAAVGVSLMDQNGKLLPVNQQLTELAKGYKIAQAAGEGQQFLMNTLGARGLALVPVLNNLAKAQKEVADIQGTGLNTKEMQDLQLQLRALEVQSGQLKVAFGGVFAELLGGDVKDLTLWLGDVAKGFRENREEIKRYTSTVMGLVAAYSAMKAVSKVGNVLQGAWEATAPKAAQETQDAALTAQQERAIQYRERRIYAAAQKEENAYYKTLQTMKITEQEKTELFTKFCIERETIATEKAASHRAKMTEVYLSVAAKAKESSESQILSIRSVGAAAEETAVQVRSANVTSAESAALVSGANAQVSESYVLRRASAAETAAIEKTANAEVALSAEAASAANTNVAVSAEAAGAAGALAGNKAKDAAVDATKRVGEHALAHGEVGRQAAGATGTIISGSGRAIGAVRGLTSMVWALAGGWLGVAAAIAYASYCAYQYAQAKEVERQENTVTLADGTTATYDGSKGRWYTNNPAATGDYNVTADPTGTVDMSQQSRIELTEDQAEEANQKYTEKNWEGSDAQRKQEAEDAKNEAEERVKNISIPTPEKTETGKAEKVAQEKTESLQTVNVPIGQVAYNIASAHIGEDWGDSTCAEFFSAAFAEAGFDIPVDNQNWVPDIQAEADRRGAYHSASSGYEPKKGDAVIWGDNDHIGISNGDGTHIASNSHGVTSAPDSGYYSYGNPVGYIDMSAMSGGKTVAMQMDKAGAAMVQAANTLAKEQDKANNLMSTLKYGTVEDTITEYQKSQHQISVDVNRKSKDINEMEAAGVDVSDLRKQLVSYQAALEEKLLKPWREANAKIRTDTEATLAALIGDYEKQASVQKDVAIQALEKERIERTKNVAKNKDDTEAMLAVDKWYYAERSKIDDEYTRSLQQAQNKRLQYLTDKGMYREVLKELQVNSGKRQSYLDVEGEKKAASEVIKIWDAAHASIAGDIAGATENLYGSLTSSIQGFITRTKSAMDVVHDLGNAILSEIARIYAQKLAANIIGSLFGGFGGGGTVNSSVFSSYLPSTSFNTGSYTFSNAIDSTYVHPFSSGYARYMASGGIVTAPTLAMVGEGSEKEAVMPLSQLENFVKRDKGGTGGVQVNIINNSSASVSQKNARYDEGLQKYVLDIVVDGAERNVGGFNRNLKSALGS